MMIYSYRCMTCKEVTDASREIDDRNNAPPCEHCGKETRKIISLYRVHRDLDPYYDDNLETFVQSKQHRKQVMQQQGVSEHFGQNWHTSAIKKRKPQ